MNLSPKQHPAIPLLASGKTGREVASELKVTPQTISEWKRQPAFVAAVNKLRKEALDAVRTRIQHLATESLDVLLEIAHEAPNHETRRKAAGDLLRMAGVDPACRDVHGLGIGPETPEAVQEQWDQIEYFRKLTKLT